MKTYYLKKMDKGKNCLNQMYLKIDASLTFGWKIVRFIRYFEWEFLLKILRGVKIQTMIMIEKKQKKKKLLNGVNQYKKT